MHSSTSSSRRPVPEGPWARIWIASFAVVLLVLVPYEMFWRSKGFKPWAGRAVDAWCLTLDHTEPDSVAILGTSRILAGVDPAVLAVSMQRPVAHLAINGGSPLPILEHLAANESFRGTVIVDLIPRLDFDPAHRGEKVSRDYLKAYADFRVSPARRGEAVLSQWLEATFVSRNPALSWKVASVLASGRMPSAPYGSTRPDRFLHLDFSRADVARLERDLFTRASSVRRLPNDSELNATLIRIERAVQMLRSRGCAVVFVRMPSMNRFGRLEEKEYPRSKYWDVFATRTGAATVHWRDYPSLTGFTCPEGSHLDGRDAPRFTRRFAEVLSIVLSEKRDVKIRR